MTTTASERHPKRGLLRWPGYFAQRAKLIVDLSTRQITQADIDALPPMGKELGGHARARQRSQTPQS